MKHIYLMLRVITGIWLFANIASCSGVEEPLGGNNQPEAQQLALQVNIPGAQKPETRSMAGAKENEVKTIDILLFAVNGSNRTFIKHVQGTSIVNKYENDKYTATFKAQIEAGTSRQLIIIANAAERVGEVLADFQQDDSKEDILEALTCSLTTGIWLADGTGTVDTDYSPIPMYGETATVTIGGGNIPEIPLTRMLARIDVINQASNFTLQNIYLVNRNTTGYIARHLDGSTGVNQPASTGKVTPASLTNALKYALSTTQVLAQSYEGEIYTFEAAAPADNNEAVSDATCLIIEGKYNKINYFYRVDFTKENTSPTQYLSLLRNYQYQVVITEAAGVGYLGADDNESFNLALNSYTVPSNLKTRMISYDMSVIKNIVYNGQYMLGVNNAEIEIPKAAKSYTDLLKVHTDNPSGWKATVTSGASWLTLTNPTSGNADLTSSLGFTAAANPGPGVREATITLTAGRLTHTVTIKQTYEKTAPTLRIVDKNNNDIDLLLFDTWYNGGATIPLQVFKLLWEPEEAKFTGTFTATTPSGFTAFSYTAGSDKPASLNATQVAAISGGEKSFSIQPSINTTSSSTTRSKATTITFTLEHEGLTISKTLTLQQNAYYIGSTGINNPYDLNGNTYSIRLLTNSEWKYVTCNHNGFLDNPLPTPGITGGNNDLFSFKTAIVTRGANARAMFTFSDPTGKAPNHTTVELKGLNKCGTGPSNTGTRTWNGITYTLYPVGNFCFMVEPLQNDNNATYVKDGVSYYTYDNLRNKTLCEDMISGDSGGQGISSSMITSEYSSDYSAYLSYMFGQGYGLGYYKRDGGNWVWTTQDEESRQPLGWGRYNWTITGLDLIHYRLAGSSNTMEPPSDNDHAYPVRCAF